jgi:hypothetical protein
MPARRSLFLTRSFASQRVTDTPFLRSNHIGSPVAAAQKSRPLSVKEGDHAYAIPGADFDPSICLEISHLRNLGMYLLPYGVCNFKQAGGPGFSPREATTL